MCPGLDSRPPPLHYFLITHVSEASATMPRASKSMKSCQHHVSCSPPHAPCTADAVEPLPACQSLRSKTSKPPRGRRQRRSIPRVSEVGGRGEACKVVTIGLVWVDWVGLGMDWRGLELDGCGLDGVWLGWAWIGGYHMGLGD